VNHNFLGAGSLYGMDVIINPMCDDVPRMSTHPDFAKLMPQEFVADLDAWMIKFFGRHDVTYAMNNGRTLVMGPKTERKLRAVAT
jgi:hypothetical protein